MKLLLENVIRSLKWVEIEVAKCYTGIRASCIQAQDQNTLLFPNIFPYRTGIQSFHANATEVVFGYTFYIFF